MCLMLHSRSSIGRLFHPERGCDVVLRELLNQEPDFTRIHGNNTPTSAGRCIWNTCLIRNLPRLSLQLYMKISAGSNKR